MTAMFVRDADGVDVVEVDFDCPISIGGGAGADIVLPGLATLHARLVPDGSSIVVEPIGPLQHYGAPVIRRTTLGLPARLFAAGYAIWVTDASTTSPDLPAMNRLPSPIRLVVRDEWNPRVRRRDAHEVTATDLPAVRVRYEPTDEVEARLVDAIRTAPSDALAREVYADWLEHNGFGMRAQFMHSETVGVESIDRLRELAVVHDVAWRALASRAAIERCAGPDCPGRWSELAGCEDDARRRCGTCARDVRYCASLIDARAAARDREPIAIDAALDANHVLRAYDAEPHNTERARCPSSPPTSRRSRSRPR